MYKYPVHGSTDLIPLQLVSLNTQAVSFLSVALSDRAHRFTTAMADYSSNISVVNGYTSSKLTRMSYHALQGNWMTPPRSEIPATETDAFTLSPANSKSSRAGGQARWTDILHSCRCLGGRRDLQDRHRHPVQDRLQVRLWRQQLHRHARQHGSRHAQRLGQPAQR